MKNVKIHIKQTLNLQDVPGDDFGVGLVADGGVVGNEDMVFEGGRQDGLAETGYLEIIGTHFRLHFFDGVQPENNLRPKPPIFKAGSRFCAKISGISLFFLDKMREPWYFSQSAGRLLLPGEKNRES